MINNKEKIIFISIKYYKKSIKWFVSTTLIIKEYGNLLDKYSFDCYERNIIVIDEQQ